MISTKTLTTRWFQELWNEKRIETVDELLSNPCEVVGLPQPITQPEDFKAFYQGMVALIPDLQIEILHLCEEGDTVSGLFEVCGTHAPSGQAVCFQSGFVVKGNGEQLTYAQNVVDFLPMMEQIDISASIRPPISCTTR